ncbi:hypothetical protein QQ045_011756 [Rhodiola kirilowii]
MLCGPISEWIKSHPNPPIAVMSDVFFSVAVQQLAVDVGIKRIGFTPLSAYSLHCCWGDGPDAENRANMALHQNTANGTLKIWIRVGCTKHI